MRCPVITFTMADPQNTDPQDRDPGEKRLSERSRAPAISPWLIVGLIVLLGAIVYVASAVL